jgi:hypothetical protein
LAQPARHVKPPNRIFLVRFPLGRVPSVGGSAYNPMPVFGVWENQRDLPPNQFGSGNLTTRSRPFINPKPAYGFNGLFESQVFSFARHPHPQVGDK